MLIACAAAMGCDGSVSPNETTAFPVAEAGAIPGERMDTTPGAQLEVTGISGVVRVGDSLAVVSDRSPHVHLISIPEGWPAAGPTAFRGAVDFDAAQPVLDVGFAAPDLEAIDVLPGGELAVLSERFGTLISNGRLIAIYPPQMAPIGGRGVEGLAIGPDGRVATLWEGGWLNAAALPSAPDDSGRDRIGANPFRPLVCIHELNPSLPLACPGGAGIVVLEVPTAPVVGHAFRATDLVWSRDADQLIVLLGSVNAANDEFRSRWLQRFEVSGARIGAPLNLCGTGLLPDALRAVERNNYEGLAWFDEQNLVIVNDTTRAASAFLIDIEPWPATDTEQPCY